MRISWYIGGKKRKIIQKGRAILIGLLASIGASIGGIYKCPDFRSSSKVNFKKNHLVEVREDED